MARARRGHKRPYNSPHQPLEISRLSSLPRREVDQGGLEYSVRYVRSAAKDYLCPGCGQTVAAGTSHVVAWSDDRWGSAGGGLDGRRHWHSGCWRNRR